MKLWKLLISITVVWIIVMVLGLNTSSAEDREGWFGEFTGQYGFGMSGDYTSAKACLSAGKYINDWASWRIEGNVGSLMYEHPKHAGIQAGGSFVFRLDPKIYKTLRFYTEAGLGIGYAESPDKDLLYSGVTGLIDAGVGLIFPIHKKADFIIGWKFSHVSSLRPGDKGVNTQGIMLGVRF
jgi:hypothetical protein